MGLSLFHLAAVRGHMDIEAEPARFLDAIRTVAGGGTVLSPRVTARLLDAVVMNPIVRAGTRPP